jgi:hypothetical protein
MTSTLDEHELGQLRYVLLKTRGPERGSESEYEIAYRFWFEMWRSTYAELDSGITLWSDTFLGMSEASVVFLGDQAVGLIMYDWRDLRLRAHRDTKFFQNFPAATLDALGARIDGPAMCLGQLTVHPDFRKNRIGGLMSELLVSLSTRRFLASDSPVMLALTRNDRGVNELAFRHGAVALEQGLENHGIGADVVAFYRDRACDSPLPGIASLVDCLWRAIEPSRTPPNFPAKINARGVADGIGVPRQKQG